MSVRSGTHASASYATLAGAVAAVVAYALLELAAWWWLSARREHLHARTVSR